MNNCMNQSMMPLLTNGGPHPVTMNRESELNKKNSQGYVITILKVSTFQYHKAYKLFEVVSYSIKEKGATNQNNNE